MSSRRCGFPTSANGSRICEVPQKRPSIICCDTRKCGRAELGIIGRVESEGGGVIEAGFEYLLRRRLAVSIDDECVIHPMFYSRLNVRINKEARVVPFAAKGTFED